jgi:serine/threonine protein kinase
VLSAGTRLGPYEIVAPLGAGGMGEVYRARDTKLNRDVALKVIPDTFALDPDRLARFKREAQVLASLNHPHIAAIYGFEDSGETHALVLELVEGETLEERLRHGSGLMVDGYGPRRPSTIGYQPSAISHQPSAGLPIDEALSIARQICEALEAAHEQGIIHRDLKPANIKITPDGVVKVLDFGLAKLAHPEATAGHADVTASPTITSPAMMTGVGVILGTAAYMSPEQAKGRPADKRSDIWAFGCVLFEMVTGTRPFDGEDVTDVMVAVLSKEPDWSALPARVPGSIRALIRRCLEKDRRKRVAGIAAALFALDETASLGGSFLSTTLDLMRVGIERSATWAATTPTKVLGPGYYYGSGGYVGRTYDVSPDGERLLRIKEGGGTDQAAAPPQIIVVQHWVEELKRLVPAGK